MPSFAAGVVRFQNDVFPENEELFEELSHGQSPEAFFLACADSRVETAMITQTGPGDLFVVRNAGNIVPPHEAQSGGIVASLEYAVSVLKVPHIVVCGHSDCGAMKAVLSDAPLDTLPHVEGWLQHSKAAGDKVKAAGEGLSDEERLNLLLEENVKLQLEHLKTHPFVEARLTAGDLKLHGWVYDIKTGGVQAYDDGKDAFLPVKDRYAAEIAKAATDGCSA